MGRGARSTTKKATAPAQALGSSPLHPLAPGSLVSGGGAGFSQPEDVRRRAELFSLSRDMVLASISVGVIFTSPSAVRDVVRCAREFISEVTTPTPSPPRATRPRYEGGETAEPELDDLAL